MNQRHGRLALATALIVSVVATLGTDAGGSSAADGLSLAKAQPTQRNRISAAHKLSSAAVDGQGNVHVVVKLKTESLASYDGGVNGLAPGGATANGSIDIASASSQRYLQYVDTQLDAFSTRMKTVAPHAKVTQRYDVVLGGVAMSVPPSELSAIEKAPSVEAVLPDRLEHPQTDATPGFLGAPTLWNQLGGQESAGQGVIVGVIDTGIWPEHSSLSDPDPSGKPYAAPPAPPVGARACDFSGGAFPGPAFSCNKKLIGAQRFMATYDAVVGLQPGEYTTARDEEGHGTHTATTAAGNASVASKIYGVPRGTLSGIAPRAYVMAYKVCGLQGCYSSDSAAAVQEAIKDGVRVINFSISGGANPYSDPVSLAFLDAFNAGIFVSASAGNSGPTPDTVDHREPWVTTVAASTANRAFVGTSTLTSTDGATLTVNGATVATSLATPSTLVDAGAAPYSDPFCQNSAADNAFVGKVVICRRGGTSGRAQKGRNILTRGAAGMILINTVFQDVETDNHWLPAIHLQNNVGNQVLAFLGAHPGVTAGITTGAAAPTQGDVMALFSSRGGPNQSLGVSKPDVTAPGVQILAGNTPTPVDIASGPPGQLFQAIAGTSMSSPHVAGAGALLAALKPSWTPAQIKSALMTTAKTNVFKEDTVTKADAFDLGSGRINLGLAGAPLFTFPENGASFLANQAELYKANYPSLYIPALLGSLTVNRTLKSVDTVSRTYNLTVAKPADLKITVPASITLGAGASQGINITVDGKDVPVGATRFATVTFKTGSGASARSFVFRVTIVRRQGPITVGKNCTPDPMLVGTTTDCTITITNTTANAATVSMTDPTPGKAKLVAGTTVGGTEAGTTVNYTGSIPGSTPVGIAVGTGTSPAGGYLGLSLFGIPPIAGVGDDTITNFNVPAFKLGGVSYTQVGVASNGYLVLGGGSGSDNTFVNQTLPNSTPPNNVLAPFWTDLNPSAAGAVRIGTLTDGVDTWVVVDWDTVREFSTTKVNSFEAWIKITSSGTPGEDVTYAYGTLQGNGDGGFLTVGAENPEGSRGQNYYVNGTGTLPSNGTQLKVTGTPAFVSTHVVSYKAKGTSAGTYVNYANVTSSSFSGTAIARFGGTVHT